MANIPNIRIGYAEAMAKLKGSVMHAVHAPIMFYVAYLENEIRELRTQVQRLEDSQQNVSGVIINTGEIIKRLRSTYLNVDLSGPYVEVSWSSGVIRFDKMEEYHDWIRKNFPDCIQETGSRTESPLP